MIPNLHGVKLRALCRTLEYHILYNWFEPFSLSERKVQRFSTCPASPAQHIVTMKTEDNVFQQCIYPVTSNHLTWIKKQSQVPDLKSNHIVSYNLSSVLKYYFPYDLMMCDVCPYTPLSIGHL